VSSCITIGLFSFFTGVIVGVMLEAAARKSFFDEGDK